MIQQFIAWLLAHPVILDWLRHHLDQLLALYRFWLTHRHMFG